jgi:tetratricopeptide (TPR) repeat protein
MSSHEYWNELGNLYLMNGAYEPAIHAYARSIELEGTFGRSYSNLAMAYVRMGKYADAIKLYRHSIGLLQNNKEKAITWNKLGILYRQVRDYNKALEAYQQADLLDPQQDVDGEIRSARDTNLPLTVSMPEIDLDAILEKIGPQDEMPSQELLDDLNGVLELAEEEYRLTWFDGEFVSPDPETFAQAEELPLEPITDVRSEWKLAYGNEITSIETASLLEPETGPGEMESADAMDFVDLEGETQREVQMEAVEQISEPEMEIASSESVYENSIVTEAAETIEASEMDSESVQYSQTEYPLIELSPAERNSLELDIAKYKFSLQKNPRNYAVWELLGDAYKSAGLYKDAIKAFQTAISLNSSKPSYYYRIGLIYSAERREAEAIASFQRVLELDPDYAQAYASLGSHYMKMGLTELAQAHIDKALNTEFEEESEYNRACLEAICGNHDRALELLEEALKTGQTYITWALNDPDLDSLRRDERFQRLLAAYSVNESAVV